LNIVKVNECAFKYKNENNFKGIYLWNNMSLEMIQT